MADGHTVDGVEGGNVLFGAAGRPGVLHPGGVEHCQGVDDAGLALVDGVIGGHRAAVVPGPGDGVGQFGGSVELRVRGQVGAVG